MHVSRKEERSKNMHETTDSLTQENLQNWKEHQKFSKLYFTMPDLCANMQILCDQGLFYRPRSKLLNAKNYYIKKKERGISDSQKFLGKHYKEISVPDEFLKDLYLDEKAMAPLSKNHGNLLTILNNSEKFNEFTIYSGFPKENLQKVDIKITNNSANELEDNKNNDIEIKVANWALKPIEIKIKQLLNRLILDKPSLLYRDSFSIYSQNLDNDMNPTISTNLYKSATEIYDMIISPFFTEEFAALAKDNKFTIIEDAHISNIEIYNNTKMPFKDHINYLDYGFHPKVFLGGTMHAIKLLDIREKIGIKQIFENSIWTDMIYAIKYLQNYEYAISLDEHIAIYDIRKNNIPISKILHGFPENPPSKFVLPLKIYDNQNSYKSCMEIDKSDIKNSYENSNIFLAYNDLNPSYSICLNLQSSFLLQKYDIVNQFTSHNLKKGDLLEKCKAEIAKESYNIYSGYELDFGMQNQNSAFLMYTPSLAVDYSKVRGNQIIPCGKNQYVIFSCDNVGAITTNLINANSSKIQRIPNKNVIPMDYFKNDVWKKHFQWKYKRSSSAEKLKTEIMINERKKPLFEEIDLRKQTENLIKEAYFEEPIQNQSEELKIPERMSDIIPENKIEIQPKKEYNKGGFVTKEHLDYLKYNWKH